MERNAVNLSERRQAKTPRKNGRKQVTASNNDVFWNDGHGDVFNDV